jgi:hypothetical protein
MSLRRNGENIMETLLQALQSQSDVTERQVAAWSDDLEDALLGVDSVSQAYLHCIKAALTDNRFRKTKAVHRFILAAYNDKGKYSAVQRLELAELLGSSISQFVADEAQLMAADYVARVVPAPDAARILRDAQAQCRSEGIGSAAVSTALKSLSWRT